MPGTDTADVFLRHRDAVLATLLSDPALSTTPDSMTPAGGSGTAPDLDDWDDDSGASIGSVVDPDHPDERKPDASTRAAGETRASDQIHALLSGGNGTGTASPDLPDLAARNARRRAAEPPAASESDSGASDGVMSTAPLLRPRNRGFGPLARISGPLLRSPKILAAIACVVAAILVLLVVTTGGNEDSPAYPPLATATAPLTVVSTSAAAGAALPGGVGTSIQVRSATTHCPAGSTPGMDAFTGERGKAWSCVRAYKVDGQVMTIDLGKSYTIDSIGIVPGWDYLTADGTDEWDKHRTASRVSYEFGDSNRTTYTQDTMDQRKLVITKIEPPVTTSTIVLTVLKSTGDRSINDVAISSVVITGR